MASTCRTVVYTHGGGRFGNQFLRFAHWLAWALECQGCARVIDIAFWPYASLFATWSKHPGCIYPLQSSWMHRLARMRRFIPTQIIRHSEWRVQRWIAGVARYCPKIDTLVLKDGAGEGIPLARETFRGGASTVVCSGWRFSAWAALERQENEVRALFEPAAGTAETCKSFIARKRNEYDVLVGLFVRRGDYREWAGGRYFFPWESYASWTRELCGLFPGRRVAVLLAGDESLPLEQWKGLPVFPATGSVNAGGHWMESFVELAACDYVVSAPSTFSACAAFLGNRPLWPLNSADQVMSLDQIMPRHIFAAACDPVFSNAVK